MNTIKVDVKNSITISDFLNKYGNELAQRVLTNIKPIHNPLQPHNVDDYVKKLLGLKRKPYPSQAEVIKALAKGFYKENISSMILCGEMGTGKTLLGASVCYLSPKPIRSLIMCPPHLVEKWLREIKITIPDAKIVNLNKRDCIKQLLALRDTRKVKPETNEFYVISRERAKAGYMWKGSFNLPELPDDFIKSPKNKKTLLRFQGRFIPRCPGCGSLLKDESEEGEIKYLTIKKINSKKLKCKNVIGYLVSKENSKGKSSVLHRFVPLTWKKINSQLIENESLQTKEVLCDEHLWYANNKKVRRYSPAEFICKYLKGFFDIAVFDEVHELKSGTSNQGIAFGNIGSSVDKILCLTGTLLGGYADDIFYILFRLAPYMMKASGFSYKDSMGFMREYGILEEIIYLNDFDDNRSGKGKKANKIVKRKPGISPTAVPLFLLDKTVFIKLADVAEGLPPYDEYVISVEMNNNQKKEYLKLEVGFKNLIQSIKKSEHQIPLGIISQMIQSLLSYPDSCAVRGEHITRKKKDESGETVLISNLLNAPKVEIKYLLPKEAELLSIVKEELKCNRRVLIYASFTGTRDITPRIKHVLETKRIKAEILRSTVSTDKREQWIKNKVDKEGIKVLICNPELVKTGLDLLEFPTIIFFQTGYRIDTLRQASRRSWRIGQQNPVKVFFLSYSGTMQSAALSLIAQKLDTALTVEGDLVDKGLAAMSESTDSLISDLVKGLLSGKKMKGMSAEESWAQFRKKEITIDLALDTGNLKKEIILKSEIIEAKVDKKKKAVETVEEVGNRIIKVTIIEHKRPRKKRVSHLELSKQSLDELLKKKKGSVAQLCLF